MVADEGDFGDEIKKNTTRLSRQVVVAADLSPWADKKPKNPLEFRQKKKKSGNMLDKQMSNKLKQ
jgi:hypothetical protein